MIFINNTINYLQAKNHKAFYLAFMRVAMGIFLLKEIVSKFPYASILYSNQSIFKFNDHSGFVALDVDVTFLKNYYQLILGVYILAILFFIFGIGKRFTAFIIFILILVLQKLNNTTINGGDKMARLLMFYFVFANAYEFFSYKKTNKSLQPNTTTNNLISNLAAYSMMLQLCLAYFAAFINKLSSPYWLNGTAIYYVFQTEAYQGTRFNQVLSHSNFFVYSITYFTLFFEGSFAFLIWFKKLRKPLLIVGFILHFSIYFLMMIYNLQIIFLLPYGLFFADSEIQYFFKNKLRLNFTVKN